MKSSSVDYDLYADNTQLSISFSPSYFSDSLTHLFNVVNQITQRMSSNLNPSKTEFILIGLPGQSWKIPDLSIYLHVFTNSFFIAFTSNAPVCNLGVIFLPPTTSPTSPAPALCAFVTSSASNSCSTLKLPPPLSPPSSKTRLLQLHLS